jgi:hypothetical protein
MRDKTRNNLRVVGKFLLVMLLAVLVMPVAERLVCHRGLSKVERLCASVRVGDAFDFPTFDGRARAVGMRAYQMPDGETVGVMVDGPLLVTYHCMVHLKSNVVTRIESFAHAP